ncbi:timeless-domain-containing protein [Mollisia scopiformis]|uniref:Topoisomerase 1-associated factor 1 n=1 Tax=Mollisia scopiformis TaxID=149040 RepID=A0A194XJ39_MOLSC|nr:timeless-domain-containing protein [Mollisia scopiformis]KUJ20178.1 timeless-domain-containing protein [Mollisia scopiformis]
MEFGDGRRDVVDPEVRAYVSSLVTALGGSGADEDGRYVLGDDALACLRDLKKWLKLYDEKANRLDVARCLAESNLVGGDLLQILAAWPENATEDRLKSKIALACLELLVPLTWPLEKDTQAMTVNHHRHIPYLQIAQLGYKRAIINFDGARILHTAVRCALPSMAEAMGDRSTRDEGIIKLLLYFVRNIAMIAPPPNVQYEGDEAEISRSATIDAFDYQDILHLLLTVSSTMGEEFNTQDVVVLDILFHLIKGVDIEKLFVDEAKADNSKIDELKRLRQKEASMLRSYQVNAPTRHNRFGTMAWMQREDSKMTTISGQSAIMDSTRSLAKMDSTKKFKPPRKALKGEKGPMDFDTPVMLNVQANKHLRTFVEDFLDAGFNPLFSHLRKAIDREAERILEYHPRQFFYLVSWFLEAERVRRKSKVPSKGQKPEEIDNYSLVASVLNQEMFVTLNRAMEQTFENKSWQDLSAAMKCFTQILLTVQEMSESPLEEDQEIAENILSRIFYEETTHDRIANLTRTYKDQGFGYLDSCTELAHHYLRILEQYSKQNVDMQVRSRRRIRRKKKAARADGEDDPNDDVDDSDGEDEARAEKVSRDRKFDFKRFASRFVTQGCVDTFVTFTAYYNDLKPAQLKRAHRFFYRVAFKQDMSVMLFRVDIVALLHKMIKGPEGLDPQASCFKEWDELVKQVLKKCIRKMQERPELVVEMLFSKINSTAQYLEYGYEKQTASAKPRAAAELEVKGGKEWEEQVAIVVGALLDRNEGDHLQWIKSQLSSAESGRRSWEGANSALQLAEKETSAQSDPFADTDETPAPAATIEQPTAPTILIKPDNDTRRIALFKNGHLRLLMKLVGLRRLGEDNDPEASWTVPSSLSADQLKEAQDLISKSEFSPPTFDDGEEAGDFIRRKSAGTAARKKAVFDDEDDGVDDDDEEEFLFPAGGPTAMKKSEALKALKKNRRRRRKEGSEDEGTSLTDEQLEARAEARRLRELEKNRKIKSDLFVHDSDEEADEERDRIFFVQEEKIRERAKITIMKELLNVGDKESSTKAKSRKRPSTAISVDSDDNDDLPDTRIRKRQSSTISDDSNEEAQATSSSNPRDNVLLESDNEATDTPLSSPHPQTTNSKRRKVSSDEEPDPVDALSVTEPAKISGIELEDDEDEDVAPVSRPSRQRTRAGFIVDSSDEE